MQKKGTQEMTKSIWVLSLMCALVFASANVAAIEDGLIGYWPFDEGVGQEAEDVSGNKLNGKFTGKPKWAPGKFGTALEFDGVGAHVTVADNDLLDIEDDLTIMAWFSPTEVLTSRRLMVKNDSIFVIFDFGNADSVELLVKPNNTFAESTTTDWEIGQWYHFAGTFDGDTMRVYVNGVLEAEAPNNTPIAPSALELWIGGDDFGRPTDHFPGLIDEVRIYNRTLTEAEVKEVMDTPQSVDTAGKLTTTWAKVKSVIGDE